MKKIVRNCYSFITLLVLIPAVVLGISAMKKEWPIYSHHTMTAYAFLFFWNLYYGWCDWVNRSK